MNDVTYKSTYDMKVESLRSSFRKIIVGKRLKESSGIENEKESFREDLN